MKRAIHYGINLLIPVFLTAAFVVGIAAQSSDASFKPVIGGNQGGAAVRLWLPDGRLVFTGDFRVIGNARRTYIAIILTLILSFNRPEKF